MTNSKFYQILKKTIFLLFSFLKVYLIGGIVSLLMLTFLNLTDEYFKNLDWEWNNRVLKLDKYFLFTFYIPIYFLVFYGIFNFIISKLLLNKILKILEFALGILLFCVIDFRLKKILIVSDFVLFNLLILIAIYFSFYMFILKIVKIYKKKE
jgi:hypothetical protein